MAKYDEAKARLEARYLPRYAPRTDWFDMSREIEIESGMHYTNIVLTIPHARGMPGDADRTKDKSAAAESNRRTDWQIDGIFDITNPESRIAKVATAAIAKLQATLETVCRHLLGSGGHCPAANTVPTREGKE